MSNNPAPAENVQVFNTANHFTGRGGSLALSYPIAQGQQAFPNGVQFGDSTYQNSAYTGAGALAGAYNSANITLDSNGRITAIANGSGGGPGGVQNPMTSDLDGGGYDIFNVGSYTGMDITVSEITTEVINNSRAVTYQNMGPVAPGNVYGVAFIQNPPQAEGSVYVVSRCLDPGFKQTVVLQCSGFQNGGVINVISADHESDTPVFSTAIYGSDGAINYICLECIAPSTTWETRIYMNEDESGLVPPYGSSFVPISTAAPVVIAAKYQEISVIKNSGTTQASQALTFKTNSVANLTTNTNLNLSSDANVTVSSTSATGQVNITPNPNTSLLMGGGVGFIATTRNTMGLNVFDQNDLNLNVNANATGTGGEVKVTGGNMRLAPNPGDPATRILDLGDPVNAQDAATKNYVDNSISGFLTNPLSANLDCNGFELNDVLNIDDTNNLNGTIKMLGQMTLGTKATGLVAHNFGTANNPQSSTTVGGNNVLLDANESLALKQRGMSPGIGYDNITQIQSPTGFGSLGLIGWQPAFGSPIFNPKFVMTAEKSSSDFKVTFNGQNEFFTNTTFTNPATTTTIPAADASIQIARASDAAGTVSGNKHYIWSEQGAIVGGGAADENLCIGTNAQATDAAADSPAIVIDTVRKRLGIGIAPTEDFEVDGNMQIDSGSGVNSFKFYDSAGGHDHAQITAEDDGANGGQFKIKTKQNGGVLRDGLIIREDLTVTVPGDLEILSTFSAASLEATNGGLTLPTSTGPGVFYRLLNGLQFPEPLWGETNVTETYGAAGANYPKVNVVSPGITNSGPFNLLSGAIGSNMTIDIPAQLNNCFFNITCYGTWNNTTDGGDGDATLFLRDDLNPAAPIYCLTTGNVVITNNTVRYVVTMNCDVRLQQGTYAIFAGHHRTNNPRTFTGTVRVTFSRGEI